MLHDEQTNNKLIVLFVLDRLSMPIQEDNLIGMCCYDRDTSWIPSTIFAKQAIFDLAQSGFVSRTPSASGGVMLSLTSDGALCLSHFFKDIPKSLRDDITEFVSQNRIAYKKKQEFSCDYYRNNDNTYTVVLQIFEINKQVMELKLNVPSRQAAKELYESWKEKAVDTYKAVYDLLLND